MNKKAQYTSYGINTLYSMSLGLTNVLIPLYAISLGFTATQIGLIISAQAFVQLAMRLFGGIIADQIGEKKALNVSSFFMAITCLGFVFLSPTLLNLVLIQFIHGGSRSVYWTASQSSASKIDPNRVGTIMGFLSSFVSIGQVAGMIGAGLLAGTMGYPFAFMVSAITSASALALGLILPRLFTKKKKRTVAELLRPIKKSATKSGLVFIWDYCFLCCDDDGHTKFCSRYLFYRHPI